MNRYRYLSRVSSSARGEVFNPLLYPFLFATFIYGIGFLLFDSTAGVHESSLHMAMVSIGSYIPQLWGAIAVLTILVGFTFLLFNIPPAGKLSGLVGFMVWVFATFCWFLTGGWLLGLAIGVPNMWFWIWQYLSLSLFRQEEFADKQTMQDYNDGKYDTALGGKELRESNRGVDRQ